MGVREAIRTVVQPLGWPRLRAWLVAVGNPGGLVRGVDAWWARQDPFDLVVHAGAHACQEADFYETQGAQVVVWIEGDPITLELTYAAVGSRRGCLHVVVPAVLDDLDGGQRTLYHFSNEGHSTSLYPPSERLSVLWPELSVEQAVEGLPSRSLASVLAVAGIELKSFKHSVLILDIQGHEAAVLAASDKVLLQSFDAIVCEITTDQPIYVGGAVGNDVVSLLSRTGFRAATPMPKDHGDVIFVRRKSRSTRRPWQRLSRSRQP